MLTKYLPTNGYKKSVNFGALSKKEISFHGIFDCSDTVPNANILIKQHQKSKKLKLD